jgi:plasmid maintenance system antidote protein VapI
LTASAGCVTIGTMRSMTEVIRQAVLESGLPLLRIAEVAGVERASLSRFMAGKRSLRLDLADRLAAYFGLELRRTRRKGKTRG